MTTSFSTELQFSVDRLTRFRPQGSHRDRDRDRHHHHDHDSVGTVFIHALLKYLTVQVIRLAGNATRNNKKTTISHSHIVLAIRNDEELNHILSNIIIASPRRPPSIHPHDPLVTGQVEIKIKIEVEVEVQVQEGGINIPQ